jgi:O-antigen/teichoic acid export membrane protein
LGRSLLFNSAIYIVGQFLQKALGFVLVLIYARFLRPEDFGITGTLSAYGALLSTVLLLDLHGAVGRHYFNLKKDPAELRSYLSSVYGFQIIASIILVGALSLTGQPLWRRFTSDSIAFHPYVWLMLWSTFSTALGMIPQTLYQSQERAGVLVSWQFVQGALALGLGVLLVGVLKKGVLGVLWSQLVSNAAVSAIFLVIFARNWVSRDLRWSHIPKALAFGLPLLPHSIGTILMQTVDRIMLEKYAPLAEVGLYSIAMTLGMVLLLTAGGINQAWSPHFIRTTHDEPEATARRKAEVVAALFVALFCILSIIGGLFAPELMRIFLGERYLPAVPYLIPFVIGNLIAVYYFFPANQLLLAQRTTWFLAATGSATALSIALNLYYLPRGGGAMAAAWIFVAGNVCQTGFIFLGSLRYYRSLLRLPHAVAFAITVGALLMPAQPLTTRLGIAAALFIVIYQLLIRGYWREALPRSAS